MSIQVKSIATITSQWKAVVVYIEYKVNLNSSKGISRIDEEPETIRAILSGTLTALQNVKILHGEERLEISKLRWLNVYCNLAYETLSRIISSSIGLGYGGSWVWSGLSKSQHWDAIQACEADIRRKHLEL